MALHFIHNLITMGPFPLTPSLLFLPRFAISFRHVRNYFSEAAQDYNGPNGITLRHRFCVAAEKKVNFRIIKGLAAELAPREKIQFLDNAIIRALLSLDQSLVSSSRLSRIAREDLDQQCSYHRFLLTTSL